METKTVRPTRRSKPKRSPHHDFSERAHLIRWCHERSLKELKALKKAFDQLNATQS